MGVGQWLLILAGVGSGFWGFVIQRRLLKQRSTTPIRQWYLGNHARVWTALAAGLSGFVLLLLHGAWWGVDTLFVFGFILLIGWQPGHPPAADNSASLHQTNQDGSIWWYLELKNFDQAFAWLIFAEGILEILWTEIRHPPGAVLDVGLLLIFLAMFNLLRIRHGDAVRQLRTYAIGANVAALILEINRLKMFGGVARLTTGILAAQTLLSLLPRAKNLANKSSH